MPIGTLSQKIQCQDTPSAMAPPTSGPMAIARPAMPPHAPRATARRSGGTAADRIVRLSGVTKAPPTPWMARARMRMSLVGASAAAAEPAVKIDEADDEHAPTTEPVAERGAGEQQDREGQGVGVDHPLERGERRAEVGLDDGEGGRHDEVVERDHEQGDGGDGEGPSGARAHGS